MKANQHLQLHSSRHPLQHTALELPALCKVRTWILTAFPPHRRFARFDRAWIEHWLAEHSTCPTTGQALRQPVELVPNHALREAIQQWAAERGLQLRVGCRAPGQQLARRVLHPAAGRALGVVCSDVRQG